MASIDIEFINFNSDEIQKIVDGNISDYIREVDIEEYIEGNSDFLIGEFMRGEIGSQGYLMVESNLSKTNLTVPQAETLEFLVNHLNTINIDDLISIVRSKNPGEELL